MYLLRKLGIPLAAILILSILALITAVLLFEQNELLLPSFERPTATETETTADTAPVLTSEMKSDFDINIPISGGILK